MKFRLIIDVYTSFKLFHMSPFNKNKKNSMLGYTKVNKNGVDNGKNVSIWIKMITTATHYLNLAMQKIKIAFF